MLQANRFREGLLFSLLRDRNCLALRDVALERCLLCPPDEPATEFRTGRCWTHDLPKVVLSAPRLVVEEPPTHVARPFWACNNPLCLAVVAVAEAAARKRLRRGLAPAATLPKIFYRTSDLCPHCGKPHGQRHTNLFVRSDGGVPMVAPVLATAPVFLGELAVVVCPRCDEDGDPAGAAGWAIECGRHGCPTFVQLVEEMISKDGVEERRFWRCDNPACDAMRRKMPFYPETAFDPVRNREVKVVACPHCGEKPRGDVPQAFFVLPW